MPYVRQKIHPDALSSPSRDAPATLMREYLKLANDKHKAQRRLKEMAECENRHEMFFAPPQGDLLLEKPVASNAADSILYFHCFADQQIDLCQCDYYQSMVDFVEVACDQQAVLEHVHATFAQAKYGPFVDIGIDFGDSALLPDPTPGYTAGFEERQRILEFFYSKYGPLERLTRCQNR